MSQRNNQISIHIQNEQILTLIINSPIYYIINRQNSFQQNHQKLKEENALKKSQEQINLRIPLKNELLNKFSNIKEEYGDIAAKNRMR
ncbi:unnamed protein product [Paramecium sonneborni]|uniref:Uncharacterized protein n=1 Tax=Paramecium sonneborni TaxID=65129 RepID=A0A8S1Q256_9CILI|nr:unnamed protein product [Paramecium sonneborni]